MMHVFEANNANMNQSKSIPNLYLYWYLATFSCRKDV